MFMQELISTLFRPYTLIVIRLASGEKIQGTVVATKDGSIQVEKSDGTKLSITSELLTEATYCYAASPTIRERIEPLMIEPNGKISSFANGSGFIDATSERKYNFFAYNIADSKLKEDADNGTIVGAPILFLTGATGASSIIKAETLDDVLDTISSIAKSGKLQLAKSFCELLLKQYPEVDDVIGFNMILDDALEMSKGVNCYAPMSAAGPGFLKPLGRICELTDKGGVIIDADSHERLFFHNQQLLGGLENMKRPDLIGRAVVYSVKKYGKDRFNFEARSVLPPMQFSKAFDLAETLHPTREITACDILRIILKQRNDFDYEETLAEWQNSYVVQEAMWRHEKLIKHEGEEEPYYVSVPSNTRAEPPVLERSGEHTHMVRDLSGTPELPTIFSPQELEEFVASVTPVLPEPVAEPAPEQEAELESYEELVDVLEEEREEVVDDYLYEDINVPIVELPSLDDCPDGEQIVPAKAQMTVVWGDGSVSIKGSDTPFVFRMEDIIDEELQRKARILTSEFIKDAPVVCQILKHEGRAAYICPPMSVLNMLTAARDAIQAAQTIAMSGGERNDVYALYDKARGYVLNVLESYSTNSLAIKLRDIAEDALKIYSDTCYKSPYNGVSPSGSVKVVKANRQQSVYISDSRFVSLLYMNRDEIVDNGYKVIRAGDELVYSVYPMGKKGGTVVRFVCLARPAGELVEIAEQWEKDGCYEKAWGVAMHVLDSDPGNSDASAIAQRCALNVPNEIIQSRKQVLRSSRYAQGVAALKEKDYQAAIECFTGILESEELTSDSKKRERTMNQSVHRLIESYHAWIAENMDKSVLKKYKNVGERYLLGKHETSYSLSYDSISDCDLLITFYEDMNDYVHLVDAYRTKLTTINTKSPIYDKAERKKTYAEIYSKIAWYLLVIGDNTDDAARNAEWAKNNKENSLENICEAIISLRIGKEEKVIRDQVKFPILEGVPIDIRYADRMYSGRGVFKNFTVERYAILNAIVNLQKDLKASDELLYYAGRYLATLTCSHDEYVQYVSSARTIRNDCNFVNQVFKCLEKKAMWRFWSDIRLLCMLSEQVAYRLCVVIYNLNKDLATSILVYSGIIPRENPTLKKYAESFAVWRGAAFQERYVSYIRKYESITENFTFDSCVEFLNELEYQQWMIPDDMELVNEIHWELPGQLKEFMMAANSRAVRIGCKDINSNIDKWTRLMRERPTILTSSSLHPILVFIKNEVNRTDAKYQSCAPVLQAKVLSQSALSDDRSMFIEVEIRSKEKNAEAMSECRLHLLPTNGIIPDEIQPVSCYSIADKVYGDEYISYILHFTIKSETELAGLRAHVRFDYMVKADNLYEEFDLPVKPLAQKTYKRIINDYNFGSPERTRFYGREATIENAVHSLSKEGDTPHYFIYGQKRSGKSSVMLKIEDQIREKSPSSIIVDLDFSELTINCEEELYVYMLTKIIRELKKHIRRVNKVLTQKDRNITCEFSEEVLDLPAEGSTMPFIKFMERVEDINDELKNNHYFSDSKIILFVDEFTSAYIWLTKHKITKDFMFRWKVMQKRGLFAAILIGQDILRDFVRQCKSPNPFEVLEKERLGYLNPDEARRLIVDRIKEAMDKEEEKIFVGNAVSRILYYSASSAYYTKWICQRLVELLNERKLNHITEIDVDAAVWELLRDTSEATDKFDALFLPGLSDDVAMFQREEVQAAMDIVADEEMANPISGCQRSTLLINGATDAIIQDLLDRDVIIDPKKNGYYFIKVKLYVTWRKIRTMKLS